MGTFKFDEIAFNSTEKKKPVDEDKYTYLGLEHLDSDSIYVTRYGADVAPKGDKLIMKKGDVLFGKRRAYQKKVAIAPFDGIFSAHGMVLRPKEDVIDKDFFPMFIKSDYFLDAAIKISVGSLSPTINWRDLKELKFELPSLEEQRKLAEILWAIYDMKDKYKKLILATDELVKSQFIEMFGLENEGMKTIGDVASICRGSSPRPISKYVTDDPEGVNWIKIGDAGEDDVYIIRTSEKITQDGAKKSRAVKPGDFILSNSMSFGRPYILGIDGCVHDGWLIISDYQDYLDPMFFYYELRSDLVQRQFDGSANGSTVKNLNSDRVSKVKIHIPSMELQSEFVELAKQSDKSKFVERFLELSLFYRLFSPLDSEMICIFPYFCPYAESAREIREIFV